MAKAQVETVETPSEESNPIIVLSAGGMDLPEKRFEDFPLNTRITYFIRGIKHAVQNEPASSAGKELEADLIEDGTLAKDATKDAKAKVLATWRADHEAEWNGMLYDQAMKRFDAALSGEVSIGTRGDSVETEFYLLVDKAIRQRLKNEKDPAGNKIKLPTNDSDVVTFANGATRTRKQMRDNFAASPSGSDGATMRDLLMEQAAEIVAARKVKDVALVTTGEGSPDALGL